MSEERYLLNVKTGNKFVYTEILADEEDMAECDAQGRIVHQPWAEPAEPDEPDGTGQPVAAAKPAENPSDDAPLTLEQYKDLLNEMAGDELRAKAKELEVQFAGNIGEAKLRERILESIEERLESGGE